MGACFCEKIVNNDRVQSQQLAGNEIFFLVKTTHHTFDLFILTFNIITLI